MPNRTDHEISKVAVIGAGVMGAGIAAHVANAGIAVVLLDIVPEGADNRSIIAQSAVAKMLKTKPAPFTTKRAAKLITSGNIEDDMGSLSDCDLIIEVVIERLDIKQNIYKKINAVRKKGSIVSSNTSTIPLAKLVENLPDDFVNDFVITHFFNPPRYMRLLEVVSGTQTSPEITKKITDFFEVKLGKSVVHCKDTPGFIANRIGTLWMTAGTRFAIDGGLSVDDADAVIGQPFGIPKTGIFGLMDLVGIDLGPHVAASMLATLPKVDLYRDIYREESLITQMISDGYTGRKGKGGFYRLNRSNGTKTKESIDLETGQYSPSKKSSLASVKAGRKGMRAVFECGDAGSLYAWKVLSNTLCYAASLVPEISDDIYRVDLAMKHGYGWKWGPFEMLDKLGVKWFVKRLSSEGITVPKLLKTVGDGSFYRVENKKRQYMQTDGSYQNVPRSKGVLLLEDIKLSTQVLSSNKSASLWDIGDDVLCLEFHTKMNAIDVEIIQQMGEAIEIIEDQSNPFKALVIYNEGSHFSAGANIGAMLFTCNLADWDTVTGFIQQGQKVFKKFKYADFPVIAAPRGMALGGGCEILLHCDAIQAHIETYTGLVEVGVGLIPGWGGCKEMIIRHTLNKKRAKGPMPALLSAFELISMAQVSGSAAEAKEKLFLRDSDGITMNSDRLLFDAKARALSMVKNYQPPQPVEVSLAGPAGMTAIEMALEGYAATGMVKPHDVTVSLALGRVLTGADHDITEPLSEDKLYQLELESFLTLVKNEKSIQRIEYMLSTGNPLRN